MKLTKVKLNDICNLITCGVAKRPNYVESGIPFLSARNVKKQKIIWNNFKFISQKSHDELTKYNKPLKGDILYTRVGSYGEAAIIDEDREFSIFVSLTLIKPNHEIVNNKFLVYFLNSPMGKLLAKNNVTSSGVGNLNVSKVRNFELFLPSLKEQKLIVSKLDTAIAEIDKYIANTSKIKNQLTFLTKNFLRETIKDNKYQWNYKTLSEISINLDNKRIPITKSKRNHGKIPYYGASGIVDYVSDWIFDDDLLLISEDGANLLMRTYPIAFSVYGKCWVNNHAHVLKFKNTMLQNWVENYLNSIDLSDYISGMAQPKLNQTKLNIIKIPIPREDLLEDLIGKIKSFKENSELFKLQIAKKISLIKSLKTSILQQKLNKVA